MGEPVVAGWRSAWVPTPQSRTSRARGRVRARELAAKLLSLQRDYAELHTALFEAAEVHRRLCAPRLVRCGSFEIASEIFAVRYLPGDFFTIEDTHDGLVLALGDVCGKGLSAGMWTPCLVGLVRAQAALTSDPAAIVTAVNREFCRMEGPLTSLFIARLDPIHGTLEYCSAGHPPALLLRENAEHEWLAAGGMLAGVVGEASFTSGRVALDTGDILVAYTDGIIESRNDADQEFGLERLEAHLRLAASAPADALLFSLLAALQDFAAPHALVDDTSLVVVRKASAPGQA